MVFDPRISCEKYAKRIFQQNRRRPSRLNASGLIVDGRSPDPNPQYAYLRSSHSDRGSGALDFAQHGENDTVVWRDPRPWKSKSPGNTTGALDEANDVDKPGSMRADSADDPAPLTSQLPATRTRLYDILSLSEERDRLSLPLVTRWPASSLAPCPS